MHENLNAHCAANVLTRDAAKPDQVQLDLNYFGLNGNRINCRMSQQCQLLLLNGVVEVDYCDDSDSLSDTTIELASKVIKH